MISDAVGLIAGEEPAPLVWVQTLIARHDLVRKIGAFDPKLRFGEDDDFSSAWLPSQIFVMSIFPEF
jgi:hypothetical protein